MKNTLYWGDNLDILVGKDGQGRQYFPDECVDLIYLDPPFNSKKSYNLLYKDQYGVQAPSQIRAFDDTWSWVMNERYEPLIHYRRELGGNSRGQMSRHLSLPIGRVPLC